MHNSNYKLNFKYFLFVSKSKIHIFCDKNLAKDTKCGNIIIEIIY